MNEDVLITVIMPVFNSERYIKDSIGSILNQTHINLKLLIIDDNSTDDTINIIRNFDDSRIKLYINNNYGLVESLKFGVNKVESEFMARMDSDDISHPRRLEKQLQILLETDSDICGCSFQTIDSSSIIMQQYKVPINKKDIYLSLVNNVPFCHGSLLAKTEIFKKYTYGNYSKNKTHEDYHLWKKMIKNGINFTNTNEKLYYLRIHGKSRSSKNNKFKRISQITLNRFFLEEKDNIKKIFRSKSFTEFITMRIDSRIKDNLIIVRKLYKEKKIFKFYNTLAG
jgi:glycosyltransferase involved in cell wall biosynthesis